MLEATGQTVKSAMLGGSLGAVAANIFLAASLKLVWKMLGTVQLLVHLPLFGVSFPSNAAMVF